MFTRLWRIIKLGLINFVRNWTLSLAAILMISLTLIVITIFMIINFAVSDTAQIVRDKMDLKAYFADNVPVEEIRDIELKIRAHFDVTSVNFVDKDAALARWNSRSINQRIKGLITKENNPLPRTIEIKSSDPKVLENITQVLSSKAYQDKIYKITFQENKPIIDRMFKVTSVTKLAIGSIALILMLISAIVVYNTIRLTIFSRQEEIEIMELVGASSAFVRLPFIVESISYGIAAVLITTGIIFLSLKLGASSLINNFDFGWFDFQNLLTGRVGIIVAVQLIIGIVIAVISSWISVKKYIR